MGMSVLDGFQPVFISSEVEGDEFLVVPLGLPPQLHRPDLVAAAAASAGRTREDEAANFLVSQGRRCRISIIT